MDALIDTQESEGKTGCGKRITDFYFGQVMYKVWRREWQLTPVSLPGESHGQRSLADYSPWGLKESDTTEHAHAHARTRCLRGSQVKMPPQEDTLLGAEKSELMTCICEPAAEGMADVTAPDELCCA